jgi:hypothetical protein
MGKKKPAQLVAKAGYMETRFSWYLLSAPQAEFKSALQRYLSFPTSCCQYFSLFFFTVFATLFGLQPQIGSLAAVGIRRNLPLFIGWCSGDQGFRGEAL